MTDEPADHRRETEAERLDRNFDELLQELRVSQTGVQILFAFLLGVSFTQSFRQADSFVHIVYSVTLLLCALATALFIGPVALHRMLFGLGSKGELVKVSSRLALGVCMHSCSPLPAPCCSPWTTLSVDRLRSPWRAVRSSCWSDSGSCCPLACARSACLSGADFLRSPR